MPWQHTLSPKRTALVSAALRHVDDAQALLAVSPVQAFHLAGFGPECARKAALTVPGASQGTMDKAIGHGFHDNRPLGGEAVRFCGSRPRPSATTPDAERERGGAPDDVSSRRE